MVMVLAIDLSHNHFSSGIPSALASCTALEYLNISWSVFESPIPASLATLKNLQDMDFSFNNLSGTIPVALQDMKMLHHLNLSSNRLTGEVPKGGGFSDLGNSAVAGNPGLYGTWINLPPCPNFKSKHKGLSVSHKVTIAVLISIVILILCFLSLAFSYKWRFKRQSISTDNVEDSVSSETDSGDQSTLDLHVEPTRISYEQLVSATLLGRGRFGSVYKGTLYNGTHIAVKVLNFQDKNAHKSFITECNALKRVRHRNVIKFITACSNPVLKALLLPFMSNGSLDRWLHPDGGDECKLDLNDRLTIALGIAQGMEYLHHYCFVQVIHVT
ncbi:putative leucine-rich repeat receptor-like serine/threonine-protein kinase At2g24130 [Cryptomeria japonica]|uniref:putative leucine-rich repeat receptor-like serine/threonine-protein kinase At2g24130 n=1 Tax=Cryptomeria japonica TaxID=3369 RepID=UPI0027DA87CA|nr:putative leucine-rich repeat receptor-like serine/threonine-protein kinase At2g24130 [Cryptomeria japonica]